jgi:hypothetical protein
MRAALAAARVEIDTADDEPPPGWQRDPKPEEVRAPQHPSVDEPADFTADLIASPIISDRDGENEETEGKEEPPDRGTQLADLDAETAQKLRLLRRLNPSKSQQELLAQIMAEKAEQQESRGVSKKRGWFSRR